MLQPTEKTAAAATPPYVYPVDEMSLMLQKLLQQQVPADAWQWLQEKKEQLAQPGSNALTVAFASMPRRTGKALVTLPLETAAELAAIRPFFSPYQWTVDRLARVWLLLQLDASDKLAYVRRLEQLFPAAEMNELAALYAALPLYAYPEAWRHRCTEGIRSNIGLVLDAVICNNPYPSEQLEDAAWNQLVMKAFFTEKRVDQIIGFDERANGELAQILLDFAHERWAAGRPVPALLWRGVAPFLNERNFTDLERAFYSESSFDRDAAALACAQATYTPAAALLEKQPQTKAAIANGQLTWKSLAERQAANS